MTAFSRYLLACSLSLCAIPATGQLFPGTNSGVNIGVVSAIGNRFQRLGLTVQAYYSHEFAQVNAEVRAYHNFRNLGPRGGYNELVTSLGVVTGYGAKKAWRDTFLSVVGNQTRFTNSVGYSYNLYFDKIGTTQQTGIIALRFNKVSIISENDIFARPMLDRFRTGAILVQYQYDNKYQFAINCTMWTGQMEHKMADDKDFPFIAYMDTVNGVYTNYSHGLLSGQFKAVLPTWQTAQANAGIDAEQVRNAVQNRAIHDMPFLPRKWRNPRNCHMPMLDTAGNQYLYHPGQKIRPVKPYWNLFTSPGVFY